VVGYTGGCSHPGSLCVRAGCRALPLAAVIRFTCRLWRTHTSSPSAGTASAASTLTVAQKRRTAFAGGHPCCCPLHHSAYGANACPHHCTYVTVLSWTRVMSANASVQAMNTHLPYHLCSAAHHQPPRHGACSQLHAAHLAPAPLPRTWLLLALQRLQHCTACFPR
jgi:hypothetical protein